MKVPATPTSMIARRWIAYVTLALGIAAPLVLQAAVGGRAATQNVDKGDFRYSEPAPYPEQVLSAEAVTAQVAIAAKKHCASALAASPMQLGSLADLQQGARKESVGGKLVGALLGKPGGRGRPKLAKDPVKKKLKQPFDHPQVKARLQLGAMQQAQELLVSARIAKAPAKNAFHSMFFERPDCVRIWPVAYEGYGLWGSWQLSVSLTKTTSRYRNGELVNRTVDRSGWSKAGRYDPRQGFSIFSDQLSDGAATKVSPFLVDSRAAFLQQLRLEDGPPAWQSMGYAQPVSGIRTAGARFAIAPGDLPAGSLLVVHLADVRKGQYRTLGFPLRVTVPSGTGPLNFSLEAQILP